MDFRQISPTTCTTPASSSSAAPPTPASSSSAAPPTPASSSSAAPPTPANCSTAAPPTPANCSTAAPPTPASSGSAAPPTPAPDHWWMEAPHHWLPGLLARCGSRQLPSSVGLACFGTAAVPRKPVNWACQGSHGELEASQVGSGKAGPCTPHPSLLGF
uniref:Putative uncharacterized protein LOC387726 n=1 Tax=Homo sapiens TaxID=9606 RepID=YJ004_HUMAN|nr:PUTATIVE PSEUDOGENE: RecName: Full=Putative uncharacterized protein LOC387726 [Homo sapiens]